MLKRCEIPSVVVRFDYRGGPLVCARGEIGSVIDLDGAPAQNFSEGTQRSAVGTVTEDYQLYWWQQALIECSSGHVFPGGKDPAAQLVSVSGEDRRGATTAALAKMCGNFGEKTFAHGLDKNLDRAVAPKAQPRVKAHQGGHASAKHIEGATDDFFLETAAAERTGGRAIRTDQHTRARPAITRALRPNERGEREWLAATALPFANDVDDFFHSLGITPLSNPPAELAGDGHAYRWRQKSRSRSQAQSEAPAARPFQMVASPRSGRCALRSQAYRASGPRHNRRRSPAAP